MTSKTGFKQGRTATEKRRTDTNRRRQFLYDLQMHDMGLQELGISGQKRYESAVRFIRTFQQNG